MASYFIVLAILIFINAFFAATEMAFVSLNDAKIERQAKEIAVLDSTVTSKDSLIRELMFDISMKEGLLDAADKHSENFTSIASDNQLILLDKVSKLSSENKKPNESVPDNTIFIPVAA